MNETEVKKYLGCRIKQLRKKLCITQSALGEMIDIDQRQVAYIEGGKSFPTLKTLNKLSNAFNCTIKDLFDYEHLVSEINIKEKIQKSLSKLDEKNLKICYELIKVIENN